MKSWIVGVVLMLLSGAVVAEECAPGEGEDPEHGFPRVFADVGTSHPFCQEIEGLYRDGLTSGCGKNDDGERLFCPDSQVTRGVAAALAAHRDPFARLDPDGRILHAEHVLMAEHFDRGVYWIQFTRNIQFCSMEGWSHDWHGPSVRVDVAPLWGTVDTVLVETFVNGSPVDMRPVVRLHCK